MSNFTVVVMPGDGIGKTVMPEALRVLKAVGFQADYVPADIGWDFWIQRGQRPAGADDRTSSRSTSSGCSGRSPRSRRRRPRPNCRRPCKGKGYVYYSPIVKMRQLFDLDICIRPCRSFPGNPLNFVRRNGEGIEEPKIDAVIFRQNTEGLYSGVEWTNPPKQVRDALETHPQMKNYAGVDGPDLAVSCRILTRPACRRIIRAAFDYAKRFGYKSVTICEKPNVIRETSGMMEEEAKRIAAEYPGIKLLVHQHRRPDDVAHEEPGGLRRPGGQQHVRRHHFRRFRRAGGRAGLRGQRQHRPRGGRLRADPRLGPEIRRPSAVDRQPDRHDPGRLR